MRMVHTDDLTDHSQLAALGEIRTHLPNDFAGLMADDRQNIGLAGVPNNIIRMKSFITLVIPFVRSEVACAVNVHPVRLTAAVMMIIWVTEEDVFLLLGEA